VIEKTYYFYKDNDLMLEIQVQTKASRNAIVGEYNNRLKVAITTVPSDGKANEHLIKFFAAYFGVPQKQVTIIKGHQSKYKSISISNPKKNLEPKFGP
jgi:uncharacterized protein (TIGR00251 family)